MEKKLYQYRRKFLLSVLLFILFSMALRFLLLGVVHWLNYVLVSTYLGFFIVSLLCLFLFLVTLLAMIL